VSNNHNLYIYIYIHLVFTFANTDGLRFQLEVVDTWQCLWPRPQTYGVPKVEVVISRGGQLDLSVLWCYLAERRSGAVARNMTKALHGCLKTGGENVENIDIMTFFDGAAGKPLLRPLVSQITWHIAQHLEAHFAAVLPRASKKVGDAGDNSFEWKSEASMLSDNLDRVLLQVTMGAVESTLHCCCIGFATDKASVNGLPLCNSVISTPCNVANICVPQAADP
jgi:hypothetical protein